MDTVAEWDKEFSPSMRFNAGVEYDIEHFIYTVFNTFDDYHEPRFSQFCKLWKESKLGLIFCGRDTFRELYELTVDILQRTKQYTAAVLQKKENNILIRYAAVYLLYAFYFKQPTRPRVRIKLSYQEFIELRQLMEEAKKDKHYDILYAWSKLIYAGAFHYSVVSDYLGLDVAKSMERRDRIDNEQTAAPNSYFQTKDFQNMMKRLGRAHDNYVRIKDDILKEPTSGYSLNSMDVGLMDRISEITEVTTKVKDDVVDKKPENSEIGDNRKKLKERFFNLGFEESVVKFEMREESKDIRPDKQTKRKRKSK